jgi:hypothetical protein
MEITKRMAVLIDADNVSHRVIEAILSEVAKYGMLTSKRIYGDWSASQLNGWKEKLHSHAITPIQLDLPRLHGQFRDSSSHGYFPPN